MPDQFDVQRQMDEAAGDAADEAMEKLAECKEKGDERQERLVRLDDAHYFDPQNKQVLFKDGTSYVNLGHNTNYEEQAAGKIEEDARRMGYTPIAGGLFWDQAAKRLYVKNGGHYVLYALDRR